MEQGEVMRVTGLQVLGLQFIIAEIRNLTSESIPLTPKAFEKQKSSLKTLKGTLDQAVIVLQKCQHGIPFNKNLSLKEGSEAERTYMEVNNLLLGHEDAAKQGAEKIALFQEIAGICERFFTTGECPEENRRLLHAFCIKASNRLDFIRSILGGEFITCRT